MNASSITAYLHDMMKQLNITQHEQQHHRQQILNRLAGSGSTFVMNSRGIIPIMLAAASTAVIGLFSWSLLGFNIVKWFHWMRCDKESTESRSNTQLQEKQE